MRETVSGQKVIGTKAFGVVELCPCLNLTFDGDLLTVLICFQTQQAIEDINYYCIAIKW